MADPVDLSSDSSLSELSSSDLSSVGSRSPSIGGYPSPISSQDQESLDASSSSDSRKRKQEDEGTPVAKKRKRPEPKPRTTETLDLTQDLQNLATEQKDELELLLRVLRKRRKIVVIAGAGISVSAGIPDFRSSTGLFKSLKSEHKLKASGKQLFDASVYQTDSSTESFHDMVRNLSGLVSNASPTAFHQMLSTLGTEGRLMRLYTQNVDGIDVALPSLETTVPLSLKGPWPRTVQLHGGLEKMVCSKCRALSDFEPSLFTGPAPPPCSICIEADRVRTDHAGKRSHGIGRLRPRIVLYNEHNPDEEAIGGVVSADLRARPDALIVVGTSMKIPGVRRIVREMCGVVRGRRDGLTVWINHDSPPPGIQFEDCWDLIVKGPCDEVARQWEQSINPHEECSRSDVERAKDSSQVEVLISNPSAEGLITPAASPLPGVGRKPTIKLHVNPKAEKKVPGKVGRPPKDKDKDKDKVKGKSSIKRIKKAADVSQGVKINKKFKTGKPNTKALENATSISKIEPGSPKLALISTPYPMEPVSPSAARVNGPAPKPLEVLKGITIKDIIEPSTTACHSSPLSDLGASPAEPNKYRIITPTKTERPPPLSMPELKTPSNDNRSGSGHREGTISPTSVPRGMENLIST